MKKVLVATINLYQKTLSPDHGWFSARHPGGFCKYQPSCSEYSKQAIEKKGVATGVAISIWRILRCNPWSQGGADQLK
ncbi:MAG: membrane protein insertion efficiency factor YidD [Candidatus Berkelbacteria bacterium]|nr:membrane protein insertion efficiency factor YidD [Candidatus Berkelbacteria bacterium]